MSLVGPSGRHQFVVAVTAAMPVQLKVLAYARLARLRFGLDHPVVLEVDRPGLDILAAMIETARRELDASRAPLQACPDEVTTTVID